MRAKSRFIGGRFEPAQQHKLIVISVEAGEPGNMSAALRWLVDQAYEDALRNVQNESPTKAKSDAGDRQVKGQCRSQADYN